MRWTKWIGAGLGALFGGPMGGIIGFVLGSAVEGFTESGWKDFRRHVRYDNPEAAGFEMSLLILSAYVIKADGQTSRHELNYVRQYFIHTYGAERAEQLFKLFKNIVQQHPVSLRQVALQVQSRFSHPMRLQLMHYLFGIARADGRIHERELELLQKIAGYLYIGAYDFKRIQGRYVRDITSAYATLGLSRTADPEEIKSAYRQMVKKYHPDKVSAMGEPYVSQAKKRFQEIQQAYESLKRERGF